MRVGAARRVALKVQDDLGAARGSRRRRGGRVGRRRGAGEEALVGVHHQRAVPPQAGLALDHVLAVERALVIGDVAVRGQDRLAVDRDLVDDQGAVLAVHHGVVVVLDLHLVRLIRRGVDGEDVILGRGAGHALADLLAIDQQVEMRVGAARRVALKVQDDLGVARGRRRRRDREIVLGQREVECAVPPHAFLAGDHVLAIEVEAVVGDQRAVGSDGFPIHFQRFDQQVAVLSVHGAVVEVDDLNFVGLIRSDLGLEGVTAGAGRTDRRLAQVHTIQEQPELRPDPAGSLPRGVDDEGRVDETRGGRCHWK